MAKLTTWTVLTAMLLLPAWCVASGAENPPAKPNHCIECHSLLGGTSAEIVQKFQDDVHARNGLTCTDCHGGDAQQEDMDKAMDRKKGFRGAPKRTEIPELCGRCHADTQYMHNFNPKLRTDQLAQYWTSMHGKRLHAGDTRAAVCSDCHEAHGIQPVTSPLSSVYPQSVPETCGRCHADAAYMKTYGIPTNQLANYRASVHYQKLASGELAAPTCATCHGNHGATPPGVSSVERVCVTCHVFQQQLFDQSPHKAVWEAAKLSSCITCHSNHRIEHPSDAMIGTGEKGVCAGCHTPEDSGGQTAQKLRASLEDLDGLLRSTMDLLDHAERLGMLVTDARLTLAGAREKLIKARVGLHSLNVDVLQKTTSEGEKLARAAQQDGQGALAEYSYRRKGLALSIVIILLVVFSLSLLIRKYEL
jgi:Cytochrome c3